MTTDPKLSADMLDALDYARQHGGELVRFAGKYWSTSDTCRTHGVPDVHFRSGVIQALVWRGKLEYSQWRDGHSGRFPVAAKLKERA